MISLLAVAQTGKNTHYAEYVRCSSVIAPRTSGGVWHNMACAKHATSGLQNCLRAREPWCMWLVKLVPKCQENGQGSKKR